MKRIVALALLSFAQLIAAAPVDVVSPESVGMSSSRLDTLKQRLQQVLDEELTGGIQVLIARRGGVVMYENLGYADVEERRPVSEETLFRIYSMTKPITGTAMMMLYEEGRYSMSDPLSKHIPEFADLKVYDGTDENGDLILVKPDREPTIHDLMQHTAGLAYGIFGDDTPVDRMYVDQTIGNYDETLQVLIDELAATPLLYQPGTRWVYSVAVDVQGYLIEKWTGKTAGEYLQEKLFEPLGMDQTMAWVPPEDARLLANVYTHDQDGNRAVFDGNLASNHFRQPGGFSGGGQLISTADDYWRFSQMLLNGGEFDGVRYLSPRTVDMMRDHRLPAGVSLSADGSTGFGLNFGVITDASGIDYPASDGEYFWGGLASTVFWIDPKEELIVVMLTQYLPFNSPYYRDLMHRMVHAAIIE